MNILFICIVIFIVFMAAGYAGLFVQTRLTEAHKTGESKAVLSWLADHGLPYFTAAPSANREAFDQLVDLRQRLGLAGRIHSSTVNPAIYFRAPGSRSTLLPRVNS